MQVTSFILQGILGLMFLMAGAGKLAGSKMHVEGFKRWGLPQWFRQVTGLVELLGAAAMIAGFWDPSWAAAGALWLGITAFVGILVHVRAKDSFKDTFMIILLLVLSAVLFIMQYGELANFPGFQ
ncbi:DoxX family protein [Paenibacillus sp. MBLB4367]|uniref:DoxX family protein n=1 Tax=Paenibacillus sp. MBLB4367 TaxID=3384767 RepID=UPI0039083268